MKYLATIFLGMILVSSSCKKEKDSDTTPAPADSAYFFRFTLSGTEHHFRSILPENILYYPNEIKGVQANGNTEVPLIVLNITWPANYIIRENDVLGLEGQTLSFASASLHPRISYLKENNGVVWYSEDTPNSDYYVKISDVRLINAEVTPGALLKIYAITGTCSAIMTDGTNTTGLTNGSFNLAVSVQSQ
jgi:hypothetical protein